MCSCKKNCSCNLCKNRLKPCGVIPVSKAIKAIDVCEIPKCDCSGRVNYTVPEVEFIANICPNCNLQGSFVSTELLGIAFNSTLVSPPQCISTNVGTILNVTGFGTIKNVQTAQGTFTLQLLQNFVGDNVLQFNAAGFDQNGIDYLISLNISLPDDFFIISFCNSCHSSSSGMLNKTSKSHNLRENLIKGKITIMRNGHIEVKEF